MIRSSVVFHETFDVAVRRDNIPLLLYTLHSYTRYTRYVTRYTRFAGLDRTNRDFRILSG